MVVKGRYSLNTAEASRQLHDGSKGVTPGHRRGHVGHQEAFQHVQNFILGHLKSKGREGKHNIWWPLSGLKFVHNVVFNLCVCVYVREVFGWDSSRCTWMGSSSSHCPDTSRSPYSPMHQDATCTRGCYRTQRNTSPVRCTLKLVWMYDIPNLIRDPNQNSSDLWDVIQQCFVKSLYCVGMHLHTVGDELDEVGNRVVSHIAPCL